MPKTTLLCPTDFSASGDQAAAYAVAMAGQLGGWTVHLLHVHHVPLHDADINAPHRAGDLEAALQKELGSRLEAQAAALSTGAVKVAAELTAGVPWREILAAGDRLQADMIVMGTLGHTGLARLLLGSVAERVVRMSDRPVLTVRAVDQGS